MLSLNFIKYFKSAQEKKYLWITGLIFSLVSCFSWKDSAKQEIGYDGPFKDDMIGAFEVIRNYKATLDTMKEFSGENFEILAVVLPEVIRWNALQDYIEIKMNEELGAELIDFSVGIFQMKPSFVLQLEQYVSKNKISRCEFIVILNENAKEVRIERLKQAYWQLKYTYVFWEVANHRFKNEIFNDFEDRIRFYAAAYNYGFTRPIEEIKAWQDKKAFLYGPEYKGKQMSYADFAYTFYQILRVKQFIL